MFFLYTFLKLNPHNQQRSNSKCTYTSTEHKLSSSWSIQYSILPSFQNAKQEKAYRLAHAAIIDHSIQFLHTRIKKNNKKKWTAAAERKKKKEEKNHSKEHYVNA